MRASQGHCLCPTKTVFPEVGGKSTQLESQKHVDLVTFPRHIRYVSCHENSYASCASIQITLKIHQEQDIAVYLLTGKGESHWALPPTPIPCLKYGSAEPRSHLTPVTGAMRAIISTSMYRGGLFIYNCHGGTTARESLLLDCMSWNVQFRTHTYRYRPIMQHATYEEV